jgi:hypothetical protein
MKKLKIATTSFIIKDNRINNIKFIKKFIDNIELLYFEGKKTQDLPTAKEINYFKKSPLNYSVHLPINTYKIEKIEKFMATFSDIKNITSFISHINYNKTNIKKIHDLQKKYKKDILIENITQTLQEAKNFIHNDINISFDIGHILPYCDNFSIMNFLYIHKSFIKYLHIYGSLDGKKHQSLKYINKSLLISLLKFAIKTDIIMCIEVFNLKDFIESIGIIKNLSKQC